MNNLISATCFFKKGCEIYNQFRISVCSHRYNNQRNSDINNDKTNCDGCKVS